MKKRILSLVLSLALLTGCTSSGEKAGIVIGGDNLINEGNTSYEMDYEVPTSSVNVLVDCVGYYVDREKEVCFRGEEHGTTFDVVDADTKAVVYVGKITDSVFDEKTGEYISHGDFSEVTKEGNYYIETDIIGRSYTFRIGNHIYDDTIHNMEDTFKYFSCIHEEGANDAGLSNCPFYEKEASLLEGKQTRDVSGGWHTDESGTKKVTDGCMTLTALAMTITYYGNVLQKEEAVNPQEKHSLIQDIMYEADWLLRMQDSTGGVNAGVVIEKDQKNVILESVDYEATAAFAGSMALCAQLLQNVDMTSAKTCATAAQKAWTYLQKQTCENVSARFYAASWLYRLTGDKKYQSLVEEGIQSGDLTIINNRYALYGKIAYISTERKMNTDICASIMQEVMDVAENTATESRKTAYYLYSDQQEICMERLLIVSIANYVTPSNEYVKILRNYVHYLCGRNADGMQYMNEDGSIIFLTESTTSKLEWEPILLLTMCGIVDAESEKSGK